MNFPQIIFKKKSVADQLQFLFDNHKEEFLKFYASSQSEKLTHSSLEKWFVDRNGKQYYRFPKSMAMPLELIGRLKGFVTWMSSGLSGQEMKEFRETGNKLLSEGIGKPETAAKMGALFHALEERENMAVHTELYYNILAIQAIREDESPDDYNNQIHIEKVNQFKEEVDNSNSYFFFQQKELTLPYDLSKISISEWTALWHESLALQQAWKPVMDFLLQEKKSSNTKKTLTAS